MTPLPTPSGEDAVHILAVDDQPDNLLILEEVLGSRYVVHTTADGEQALEWLRNAPRPGLILLDVVMPGIDGYEVCRHVKADPSTQEVPVIFLTSLESEADEERGLSLGAADFIHKPFSPPVVLARVRNHLELSRASALLRIRNLDLERVVEARTREVVQQAEELLRREAALVAAQAATITAFCSLAEARDNETGNHIRRTQNYVRALAEGLRALPELATHLTDEVIQQLFKSAPLHDVGKVGIPDAILLKAGNLNPQEWEVMKLHTVYGRDAIKMAEAELGEAHGSFLRLAREIAGSHHERWDGSGYPEGMRGEAIPLSARLMAVADVYDALISRRIYKPAFGHAQAIEMIAAGRGTRFDPRIVDVFLRLTDEFERIAREFADEMTGPG